MRITILAGGRGAGHEEQAIAERYLGRLPVAARLVEFGARGMPALAADVTVALDETGTSLPSPGLAARIAAWRDAGARHLLFLIGGAEGLPPAARDQADLVLAFGPATWPHLLVRAMLAEQLYRAFTILSGHPYHRG
ncbi:MAG: 23S rRNA (pseudouridine(1915)-N(3))-methyltransferase RlmH [Thermaurantiacus tibetensis]|uniref:23S rRNA (pseudouridine(1915)-N(3))-methyltransferase RlmH n=1 Tax=Thermaurantiacus tibetensis TaxID=2759035 RepID=UPI001F3562D4|nr:23S rRNA (pseudouridine(1915)-N(3))-methyltransferase RlmH [Thermaurantiacus tibetensis]